MALFSLNLNFAKSVKNAGKVEAMAARFVLMVIYVFFYLVCFMAAGIITVDAEEW